MAVGVRPWESAGFTFDYYHLDLDTKSIYVLDMLLFGEHWEAFGGLRRDDWWIDALTIVNEYVNEASRLANDSDFVNWRTGLDYKPVPEASVYAAPRTSSSPSGELVIEGECGAQEVELRAGHLARYPAGSLHQVMPVARGARIAAFFWIQRMVRDDGQRAQRYDLDQNEQSLAAQHDIEHPDVVRLSGLYHNLIRRWADT